MIDWTNERRKLHELIPWERNPRTIRNAQAERLADSVETFGQVETLAIGPNGEVYNGHQRLSVLAGQYGMDYEVDVRVASRPLTERERQQLTVYLHEGATGQWDWDALANSFNFDDLVTWGFENFGAIDEARELTEVGDVPESSALRDLGDKRKQIKPVLYADEVADFERAIILTGLRNRGEALLAVCRFYVEQHEQEKGQFDVFSQVFPEIEFAQVG